MPSTIEVCGEFVKLALASEAHVALSRGMTGRPPARFNRLGQDALYLSPDAMSANVAIGQYIRPDDPPRVLLRFNVGRCRLFDLRHPDAAVIYVDAARPWQAPLAAGEDPASWRASDLLRAQGFIGLVDPSRRRPGLWHITLFRWNDGVGPDVRLVGPPEPFTPIPGLR